MSHDQTHVLVVDDDLRLRELLRRYLADHGFLVSTAGDAADARAKLASLDFDLIVMDVRMPGESGLELTRSLRRVKTIPILLLTVFGLDTTSEVWICPNRSSHASWSCASTTSCAGSARSPQRRNRSGWAPMSSIRNGRS